MYDPAFFEQARKHLARAFEAAEGDPEKYRKRIEFVQVGLDYTELLIEARELMKRVSASDGEDTEAKEAAVNLWLEQIKPLVHHEEYVHAIRDNNVRPNHTLGDDLAPEGLGEQW